MTYNEFIEQLRKVRGKWWFLYWGGYPCITVGPNKPYGPYDTPLTAVCKLVTGKIFPIWKWEEAADALGIPREVAERIENATDATRRGHSREVRSDLLRVVGLREPSDTPRKR